MKQHPIYVAAFAEWKANPGRSWAYIKVADTAKLIRQQLKAKFPGTKFSVRSSSYAGGASIRISWTDGPTAKLVDAVVDPFEGAGFDGMTDYKYSVGGWLMPDGTATTRSIESHHGCDGETFEAQADGAMPVHFGADYIFTERSYSVAALARTAQAYAAKWNDDLADAIKAGKLMIEDGWRGAWFTNADEFTSAKGAYGARTELMNMAARRMLPSAIA